MKTSFLAYISCPICENPLDLLASDLESCGTGDPPDTSKETKEGLLTCRECGRWFPIRGFLPEILPDSLRTKEDDLLFLDTIAPFLKVDFFRKLVETTNRTLGQYPRANDTGTDHKKAEITIQARVGDTSFFGPGYFSPFNPGNPEYTGQLIRRFGNVVPLLELKPGEVVADMGAGYSWTSEWLMRMGFTVIGVDICRTYLEIGLQRMKEQAPHLVAADVENLPLKANCFDAILCFDAFHHVYDRTKAMLHFWRILKPGGRVALAEPGPEHGCAEGAQEVMKKYGILEKGMSLEDLKGYCRGKGFSEPEEHFILDVSPMERKKFLTKKFLKSHVYADCRFYRIRKPSF